MRWTPETGEGEIMFDGIRNFFNSLFSYLGDLFQWVLDGLTAIVKPIIDVFIGIGYFIYKIGVVLVEVLSTVGAVAKLGLGLVTGIFKTITGLSYQGNGPGVPSSIASAVDNLQPIFSALQFNKIGFVLIFSIWVFTAFAAVKIIQSFNVAGDN